MAKHHTHGINSLPKVGTKFGQQTHAQNPAVPPHHHVKHKKKHRGDIDVDFDSTCLASASYDRKNQVLYDVYFTDGRGPYEYDCDPATFKDMIQGSAGEVFNDDLR